MKISTIVPQILSYVYIGFIVLLNLVIGIRILRNPTPFPASYWDVRWAVLFAAAFLSVGGLYLLKKTLPLIVLTLLGLAVILTLTLITIEAGAAYLVLLLLVLIAYGSGEFFLRVLSGRNVTDGLERFVLAVLLGFGFLMFMIMIQGGLKAFNPLVTWSGLGILTILFVLPKLKLWYLGGKERLLSLRHSWKAYDRSGWALSLGILAVLLVPSLLIALAPANRYDELTYHLSGPLVYLREGGIIPYPDGGNNVWLHYVEMLYTLALQTAGQPLPRLLHLFMGGMSAFLVFVLGRRLVNLRVGMVASILFLAVPAVSYETSTAYIDLFVTAYTIAAGLALYLWWQEDQPRWLLVAGVFGGLGFGMKVNAGVMLASLITMFLLVILLERRLRKNFVWIGAMGGLILALSLPWLVRDTLWTGDPFNPYGKAFIEKITASPSAESSTVGQAIAVSSFQRFVSYPVDLMRNSSLYYHEAPGGMASALPLLAVPLFLLSSFYSKRTKITILLLLSASMIAIAGMILVNNPLIRYALPVFPWLAVCAALNVESLYQWIEKKQSGAWTAVAIMVFLVYLFSTRLPLIVRLSDNLPQRFPINYILGRESQADFLSRTLAVYDAFQFIDSRPGGPHRVLSIGNEFRLYSQSRIDGVWDVPEAHQILASAKSGSELAHSLAQHGYEYVLINQPETNFRPWKYIIPYPMLYGTDFTDTFTELVFTHSGINVYRLHPQGFDLPAPQNLIKNSGFEDLIASNDFEYWDEIGSVDASETAFQGDRSLFLNAPLSENEYGYVSQRVPVQGGKIHTLGYWIQSDQPAIFSMQVRWLDEAGNLISTEEQWKNIDQSWDWYSFFSQAPSKARHAEVFASLGGSEGAWIDDVCLAEGQRCPVSEER